MFSEKEEQILKTVLEEYVERICENLPSDSELENITFSEKFLKKTDRLLRRQKSFYYVFINTAAKRVACVLVTLILALATTTFSVKALREPFTQFIAEVFEKFTHVIVPNDTGGYIELIPLIPSYIPEGFKEVYQDDTVLYVYEDAEGNSLTFEQNVKGVSIGLNTEGVDSRKITVGGRYEALIFENKGDRVIMFTTDEYVFIVTVSAKYPEAELIKIVESINV